MNFTNKTSESGWRLDKSLRYHFIGVAGVAMGQAAVDLKTAGFNVTGSDAGVYSPMKELLESGGIVPMSPFAGENVRGADIVIVGNAISRGNPELEEVLNKRMAYVSLPEFLRWGILQSRKNLVITGTHGKTTTTAMIAHILQNGGYTPGYMIGGAPLNFDRGFSSQGDEWFVIEGDEYDIAFFDKRPKFLQYVPYGVIANNLEYDHSDIYGSVEEIKDAFRKLVRIIPENGILAVNGDDGNVMTVVENARCPITTFGLGENNMWTGTLRESALKIFREGALWGETSFKVPGEHNLRNALGAAALLDRAGIPCEVILSGLEGFAGVHRRLEYKGEKGGVIVYDDFAHHPTAVEYSIRAVREMHPGRKVWALFQPRSNTAVTNVFQHEWAEAFSGADYVVIAGLHRLEKIPPERRLNRELLQKELTLRGVKCYLWDTPEQILENIRRELRPREVVLVMSNSDFGGLANKIFTAN